MKNRSRIKSPDPKPFTFDRIFSRVDDPSSEPTVSPVAGVSKTDAAFEEGRKWGQQEMRASAEARLIELLEKLPDQIEEMITRRLSANTAVSKPRKPALSKRKMTNDNSK